ncbi:hypothetical protein BGW39_004061 [Mortierella sp. 14UC]|nr:hypothetical protein BGW39_004061 [Mortierella sp. 14UC]
MASKTGQILYLGGSSGTQPSPGGSLSTRFQKLSQSRNSGITVVNPTTGVTGIESRPGRNLGLGFGTGSHPQGPGGHRISTASSEGLSTGRNTGGRGGNRSGLMAGGLHTPGGLARAMQERGTGVSDAFLFAPAASIAAAGGEGPVNRRVRRQNTAAGTGGAGGAVGGVGTRASRHKALVLGSRPGRKQQNAAAAAAVPTPQQQRQRGGPQAAAAGGARSAAAKTAKAAAKAVGGPQAANAGKGKKGAKKGGKAAKPAPPNAGDLDSQLNEYMMKDGRTAASMLDNDLDSYMADKPADW